MSGLQARFRGRLGAFRLDAQLEMAPRGITALVGPSGSGKTSLIRCIAGLQRLSGEARFEDEVWQDASRFVPPHRRPIGYVFQDAGLLSHLNVQGNLAYAEKRARRASQAIARDEAIALLGLEPLLGRSTANLSGGERQRVALGRALLTQPRLLLLDEPLSSLDTAAKAEIMPYLERLHRALAIPVLYVSHDPAEVARLADHVLAMRDGRVRAADRPASAEARLAELSQDEKDALALAALRAGLDRS